MTFVRFLKETFVQGKLYAVGAVGQFKYSVASELVLRDVAEIFVP